MTGPHRVHGRVNPVADEGASRSNRPAHKRRPIVIGFLVGFGIAIPATFLALLFNWAEPLLPIVVPGQFLVRPLSGYMEHWHGAVNMGLVSLSNGLIYGLIAGAIAKLIRVARGR